MFKGLSAEAQNVLKAATAGGAAAGLACGYFRYSEHFGDGVAYWLSRHWDDAGFWTIIGAIVGGAVAYVTLKLFRKNTASV